MKIKYLLLLTLLTTPACVPAKGMIVSRHDGSEVSKVFISHDEQRKISEGTSLDYVYVPVNTWSQYRTMKGI